MKRTNIFKKAVSVIASVIMIVSASAVNVNAADETPDYTAMTERLVYLVNEARTESGLEPIYAVPYLNEIAEERAEECVDQFGQARIAGDYLMTAIDYEIAPWSTTAEISATGVATPEETFEQWKESPSQWAAIMSPEFTHMGVGVAYDPESYNVWYWEQVFITVDVFERPDGDLEGQYLPEEIQAGTQIVGDINGDGMTDSFDFILLCRYINRQVTLTPQQIKNADVLRDGNVSYSDAAVLRQYILGENIEMPVKLF